MQVLTILRDSLRLTGRELYKTYQDIQLIFCFDNNSVFQKQTFVKTDSVFV